MYDYKKERPGIFTEPGVETLIKLRENARALTEQAGAAQMGAIIRGVCGDTWLMLACVDYMVEKGELKEIQFGPCTGQNRIFVKP